MPKKPKIYGFGFNPEETHHHFTVFIPALKTDSNIYIFEKYEWNGGEDHRQFFFEMAEDPACRVVLKRDRWKTIAEDAKAEFNKRLQRQGLKTAKWKTGMTPMNREMGKEMALLAWAVEDADPAMAPYAVKNWLGLTSEERWWLFTMTNAATGQAVKGRGKGWRKAVRYALTENPVMDVVEKRGFNLSETDASQKKAPKKKKRKTANNKQLSLFDGNETAIDK